jgi:hypothetical protein
MRRVSELVLGQALISTKYLPLRPIEPSARNTSYDLRDRSHTSVEIAIGPGGGTRHSTSSKISGVRVGRIGLGENGGVGNSGFGGIVLRNSADAGHEFP